MYMYMDKGRQSYMYMEDFQYPWCNVKLVSLQAESVTVIIM